MKPDFEKARADLLNILDEAIVLLGLPGNDFSWSFWEGADEAIAEVRKRKEEIARDDFSHLLQMEVLFLVAGPMQEVSLSSGWSQNFLDLAARFDQAIEIFIKGQSSES